MTSCPEAILGDFWKKQLVEIWGWTKQVDFLSWARPDQWTTGCPRAVWSGGTVSIVEIVCVSLSPRVEKPKSQEGNKSFVTELKKVVSVSGFLCMWTFYASVYVTHPYICILVLSWICYMGVVNMKPWVVRFYSVLISYLILEIHTHESLESFIFWFGLVSVSESERDSTTGVRTGLLRCRSPARQP